MEALYTRRSIRRFAGEPVPREALEKIVEAARLSPTGMNRQPLRFAVVSGRALCGEIFRLVRFAGLIPDGSAGPDETTQPRAYIAILRDLEGGAYVDMDAGAACMSMLLAAQAQGIASCWLASGDKAKLLALVGADPERYAVHSMVALGYPAMGSRAIPMRGGDTAYYLEAADSLCVPKRPREEAVLWIGETDS